MEKGEPMSILIKGMEMPKGADQIWIDVWGSQGLLANKIVSVEDIVEIPTPHGRLIDRSVLFEEYQNLCNGLLCRDCPFFKENSCSIEEWILNQPPILEAEE